MGVSAAGKQVRQALGPPWLSAREHLPDCSTGKGEPKHSTSLPALRRQTSEDWEAEVSGIGRAEHWKKEKGKICRERELEKSAGEGVRVCCWKTRCRACMGWNSPRLGKELQGSLRKQSQSSPKAKRPLSCNQPQCREIYLTDRMFSSNTGRAIPEWRSILILK